MLMWLRSRPWASRAIVTIGCVVVVAVQWVVIAHRRAIAPGDFDVSREFGRRFLEGQHLYEGGLHYPYLPSAALYFAPLALVDSNLGILLRYGVAVGCLWLTLLLLHMIVRERSAQVASKRLTIGVLTLVLASQYIIRDLDDGGPHIILLAILVAGIYSVWKGRDRLGAIWFGLATALKVTPGLFLLFFIWKRQWRLAACSSIAAACWIALPIVWMGPSSWWSHHKQWTRIALGSILGTRAEVAEQSELRVQNQALKPALMRYLMTYPEGHPLRLSHRGYVPFLNLKPATASRLATGVMLVLLAICAWQARRRYQGSSDPAWLLEASAVLILALLLSPVTWLQHLVLMVPALYLIVAEDRGIRRLGTPASAAMAAYVVLSIVLNRDLLGRETNLLLLSYHTHTLGMLLVLGVLLMRRPTAAAGGMSQEGPTYAERLWPARFMRRDRLARPPVSDRARPDPLSAHERNETR
jgi:hypothetical protein